MKKLPLSLIAASVSVLASQASAKTEIMINENLVDKSAIDDITSAFHNANADLLVEENLVSFAQSITLDDKPIEINPEDLVAANQFDDYDATEFSESTAKSKFCYSNCYSNCHGSRGWR